MGMLSSASPSGWRKVLIAPGSVVSMMGMTFLQDLDAEGVAAAERRGARGPLLHGVRRSGSSIPARKYPEESVREIDRCVKNGLMVGVKLWVARAAGREAISTRSWPAPRN